MANRWAATFDTRVPKGGWWKAPRVTFDGNTPVRAGPDDRRPRGEPGIRREHPARRARSGGDGGPHRHPFTAFRVKGLSASDKEVSEDTTFGGKPWWRAVAAMGCERRESVRGSLEVGESAGRDGAKALLRERWSPDRSPGRAAGRLRDSGSMPGGCARGSSRQVEPSYGSGPCSSHADRRAFRRSTTRGTKGRSLAFHREVGGDELGRARRGG